MTGKRPIYDDEFRASAVLMLEAAGYPHTPGALQRTANHLGLHISTLSRWARGVNNPPPSKVGKRKKIDLLDAINQELAAIFGRDLDDVRAEASYKDRMTAAGILIDKRQLLEGGPTARTEIVQTDARDKLAQQYDRIAEREPANDDTQYVN